MSSTSKAAYVMLAKESMFAILSSCQDAIDICKAFASTVSTPVSQAPSLHYFTALLHRLSTAAWCDVGHGEGYHSAGYHHHPCRRLCHRCPESERGAHQSKAPSHCAGEQPGAAYFFCSLQTAAVELPDAAIRSLSCRSWQPVKCSQSQQYWGNFSLFGWWA